VKAVINLDLLPTLEKYKSQIYLCIRCGLTAYILQILILKNKYLLSILIITDNKYNVSSKFHMSQVKV